jgi:hypothetical protein
VGTVCVVKAPAKDIRMGVKVKKIYCGEAAFFIVSVAVLALNGLAGCGDPESSEPGGNVDPARQENRVLYVGNEGSITWYGFDDVAGSLQKRGELNFGYATTFFAASRDGRTSIRCSGPSAR